MSGRSIRLLGEQELANTRHKLGALESLYSRKAQEAGGDDELRDLTLGSLRRLINQLKEEIVRS